MNRFCKAMSHLNSTQIDEKIKFLDKQLKKTGIVLEAGPTMGTGNIYQTFRYDFTPAKDLEYSNVPDPNGVTDSGFVQPSNGFDADDSDTWENAYNDFSWLYNSNDVGGESDRPVTDSIDVDWTGGVAGSGIMLAQTGWGQSLGYLSNAGVYQPLITAALGSSTMVPPIERGSYFDGAHYKTDIPDDKWAQMQSIWAKYQSMIAAGYEVATQTIKVWYGWSYFFNGSWEGYSGVKRESDKHILINATFFNKPNEYVSQEKELAKSSTTLLTQRSLDDPSVYPGNPNRFMDFLRDALDVGEKAFEWLTDKAGEVRDTVQDTLDQFMDELEGNESNLPPKVKDFIQDTKDSSLTQSIIDNVLEPFREKMAEKRIVPAAQNVVNYLTDNLPDNLDNDYLNSLEDGYVDKVIATGNIQDDGTFYAGENIVGTAQVPREDGDYVEIDFNMGFKDNITDFADRAADPLYGEVNPILQALYDMLGPYSFDAQTSTGVPLIDMAAGYIFSELIEKAKLYGGAQDKPGTLRISKEKLKELNPTMYYGLSGDWTGDQSSTPSMDGINLAGLRPDGSQGLDSIGAYNRGHDGTLYQLQKTIDGKGWIPIKKAKNKGNTQVAHYEPQGELISEGWESPKYTYVDKDQQKRWFKEKDILPVYPKKAPPKMVKGWHPKFVVKLEKPIPVIKVSKKDLERSHTFKPDEVEELMQLVKNLNDYIKRNPDHLAYARVRYPKHDTRLAALNYKLDMQLAAADEYVETRFPENERLFDRLMKRTKESIKLTDPKTYENDNGKLITFNKLARIGNDYQPRKIKVKKKPKMSQDKLFLLPDRKKKDDILKDKMAVLDNQMKKTMPDM